MEDAKDMQATGYKTRRQEEKELKPAEKIAMFRKSRGKNRTSPAASAASGKKKTTDSS